MAYGQAEVEGTVTDGATGDPLPGGNVTVPGTTVGTATDAKGRYSLSMPAGRDSLSFSFVGYETRTVAIKGRSTINCASASGVEGASVRLRHVVVVAVNQENEKRDLHLQVEGKDGTISAWQPYVTSSSKDLAPGSEIPAGDTLSVPARSIVTYVESQ